MHAFILNPVKSLDVCSRDNPAICAFNHGRVFLKNYYFVIILYLMGLLLIAFFGVDSQVIYHQQPEE